jgi:membrane protein
MEIVALLKETAANFTRHKGQWLAAAIAYFTMLAIAPLIIVVVEIAGAFLGQHQAVLDELYHYLAQSASPSAEIGVRSIVTSTFNQHNASVLTQIISWSIFVFAAIGLFTALQSALNTVLGRREQDATDSRSYSHTRRRARRGHRHCAAFDGAAWR